MDSSLPRYLNFTPQSTFELFRSGNAIFHLLLIQQWIILISDGLYLAKVFTLSRLLSYFVWFTGGGSSTCFIDVFYCTTAMEATKGG